MLLADISTISMYILKKDRNMEKWESSESSRKVLVKREYNGAIVDRMRAHVARAQRVGRPQVWQACRPLKRN